MDSLFLFLIIIILGVIVYEDFKYRAIHVYLIPLLAIALLLKQNEEIEFNVFITYYLFNISFLLLNYSLLTIYLSIKKGTFINILSEHIGAGDWLFLLAIATAFSTFNFILFFTIGLILTVIYHLIITVVNKKLVSTIPLAGTLSIFFMICCLFQSTGLIGEFNTELIFFNP